VDSDPWVIQLDQALACDQALIGGKAWNLAQLQRAGFRVSTGFCIKVAAYDRFLHDAGLTTFIQLELGRKSLAEMRWEELWDAALRIRNRFSAADVPSEVAHSICSALQELGTDRNLAVRSSAPGEDSVTRSFAGLHESLLHVVGKQALLDAVRLVWASLWSDAALLYRKELALDPLKSQMAVLVQEMRDDSPSGVAFGRDPRAAEDGHAMIEAVPGLCRDLVDGNVDPDRWIIDRSSRSTIQWRPGSCEHAGHAQPLLQQQDLNRLLDLLDDVEGLFGWCPDVEWTGRSEGLAVLQARPVTVAAKNTDEQRAWYLTLRPGTQRLGQLCHRVVEQLIPELAATGARLAAEQVERCDDVELADRIADRQRIVQHWKRIYWDEFIPFAHGVRYLGLYYNDAVHPADPYEFVGILQGEDMLAVQRNRMLKSLSVQLRENRDLEKTVRDTLQQTAGGGLMSWPQLESGLSGVDGAVRFLGEFRELLDQFMDIAFSGQRLADHTPQLLHTIVELASRSVDEAPPGLAGNNAAEDLERRLLDAVGPNREEEAQDVVRLGRLSWRLRDDDNMLVAKLESQLLRALQIAADRLWQAGRLNRDAAIGVKSAGAIMAALRDSTAKAISLPPAKAEQTLASPADSREIPRQLVGQPAAPGLATGTVRVIREPRDLGAFQAGEVLVCDAIQPMMTHVVPLAAAVVERRGGMLIHGAIIARELGIPCVNGVPNASELVTNGQRVAVDGHLGIVTIGEAEFDLELS
jgi:pyruvate,water dikinase